jgi:hypothetical protein
VSRPRKRGVFRNGHVHVQARMCSTCIFRPGNLMHLEPGRVEHLTRQALRKDSCIPCHQTTYGSRREGEAICRGYWDRHRNDVFPLRLAQLIGNLCFIEADEGQ